MEHASLRDPVRSRSVVSLLWVGGGLAAITGSFSASGTARLYTICIGLVVLVIGVAIRATGGETAPNWVASTTPWLGFALTDLTVLLDPAGADPGLGAVVALVMLWAGLALSRAQLAAVTVGAGVTIGIPLFHFLEPSEAAPRLISPWLIVATIGAAAHWQRLRLGRAAEAAIRGEKEAAEARAREEEEKRQAERERAEAADQMERERAAHAAAELQHRAEAAEQMERERAALAAADLEERTVRQERMSAAARTGRHVTEAVTVRTGTAAELMRELESSSDEILAASDLINTIASQTNMVALNATIESARAGEAGRGFAVVADEVKGLARQSATSADEISRTLAQVRDQISAATARIVEINDDMAELSEHNERLSALAEEQSASLAGNPHDLGDTPAAAY